MQTEDTPVFEASWVANSEVVGTTAMTVTAISVTTLHIHLLHLYLHNDLNKTDQVNIQAHSWNNSVRALQIDGIVSDFQGMLDLDLIHKTMYARDRICKKSMPHRYSKIYQTR